MTLDQPAWGFGLATITDRGETLDVWFPTGKLGAGRPAIDVPSGITRLNSTAAAKALAEYADAAGADPVRSVRVIAISVVIETLGTPPKTAEDAYLRLHLLSHRFIRPHGASTDGIFAVLPTVAWTSAGPCALDKLDVARGRSRTAGRHLTVHGIDKFPRMTDYVLPSGVRIADADRVRLGAHLAAGTTVMHEGFVNYNAGTLGSSMVEGRISAGVVVGADTDIGGGSSIMGTLSGGGKETIQIGERCLLGANAGVGISLGNDCVVEAGCYITAGAKVTLPNGVVTAARTLSGADGLLFRRNSVTGALEALERSGSWGGLNPDLHT